MKSEQKQEEPNKIDYILLGVLGILLWLGVMYLVLPANEYIQFDKEIEVFGNKLYVYSYINEKMFIKNVVTKYLCPEKLTNTTCIVSYDRLICEKFTCIQYKGLISTNVTK